MTLDAGTGMTDQWVWGPGRHSVIRWTHGTMPGQSPWRTVEIFYWHPDYEELRVLGLVPYITSLGYGVAEGRAHFEGGVLESEHELDQPEYPVQPRLLRARWKFVTPDQVRATLEEARELEGYGFLAEWEYYAIAERTTVPELNLAPPVDSKLWNHFAPLLDHRWRVRDDSNVDRELDATFTWIPLVDAVHVAVNAQVHEEPRSLAWQGFVYEHPVDKNLCALILSREGGVIEGELELLGADKKKLRWGHSQDARGFELRVEQAGVDKLHAQGWALEETGRRSLYELPFERASAD